MADHPASSFALGYLAAGSATELANDVALTIVHGGRSAQATVNFNALLAENQALHDHNAYLLEDIARLERNIERLQTWGQGLAAKLDKLRRS